MPELKDLAAASQREVVARLLEVKNALQYITGKGDNMTRGDVEEGDRLTAELDLLQDANAKFKGAAAFGDTLKGLDDYLTKPARGMVHSTKSQSEDKGKDDDDDPVASKGMSFTHIRPGPAELEKAMPTGGFPTFGHFAKAVQLRCCHRHEDWASDGLKKWDEICVKTAMSTLVDPSAGLLIPEGFAQGIEKRMDVTENLMSRARVLPVAGSSMTFIRRSDASRVDGSRHAGVSVKFEGEGSTKTATTANYEKYRIEADKIACLVEVTDELLQDSPYAIDAEISELASEAIVFKASDKMVRGTGAGMPLGILASAGTISVAKETNQAAASLDFRNITKMWMRLDPQSRGNAIWMINNDVSDELDNLAFPVGTGGVPAYLPAGGLSQTGYASLKGRPVIPMEYCETLGTVGDIILADWSQYKGVSKGGIRSDMSIHIYFERDSTCFRFVFRFGGQPVWNVPFTPYKGTTTTAPFVTLATRA